MANIDDRIVAIEFETAKFQAGVAATLTSLDKLNTAIKNIGASGDGFTNIEKSANKVNFLGIGTAFDKLKAKFGMGLPEADQAFSNAEKSSSKVGFLGAGTAWDKLKSKFGAGIPEADQAFSDVEKGSSKVQFLGIGTAFDKLRGKFGSGIPEAAQAFSDVERGANKIDLTGASTAVDRLRGSFARGFPEATDAFSGIEQAANGVGFRNLSSSIDSVKTDFKQLQVAASASITALVMDTTRRLRSSLNAFTIGPITGGFHEYETQLNAVQTILANTDGQRVSGLHAVNTALNQLNHYADKTIYNFTEMAKNIGTFTAAGVDLKTAVGSIKGIANLAAVSGSNSQQASTAMYQLSQAISAGRVGLQDWNSVVNAGMGGAVFQKALMRTGENMGSLADGAVKVDKATGKATINGESFRNSIMAKPGEESWLTGDVLTNTLKQLSGDMTDAQLKAEGFSDAQVKAIQHQAKMAVNAATQVKTLSGLLDTTKEAIGSGWAQTWQIVFGNFGEAKHLFTGLSNSINGFVGASSKARNKLLKDWKDLGGRTVLIDGLKAAFQALKSVVEPIKDAFRDIFPKTSAKSLYDMTVRFRDFMQTLKIGPETADAIRSTFRGLFAILDIGKQIVFGVFTAIKHMFGAIGEGTGGVLNLTASVGDIIVAFDQWLKKGDRLHNFFAKLGDVLSIPIHLIGALATQVASLFGINPGDGISSSLGGIGAAVKPVEAAANRAKAAWHGFGDVLQHVKDIVGPVTHAISSAFGDISNAISDGLTHNDWSSVFNVLETGLVAGVFLKLKKQLDGGINIDLGGKAFSKISDSLNVLRGSLVAIQRNIQANTMLQISVAVGVLAASVVALSLVKPDKLQSALTAISVGLGELMASMAILNKFGVSGMFGATSSLILLAGAMDTLSIAVIALSKLSWGELAKGLAGVAGLLLAVSAASLVLGKAGPGMITSGIGLLGIATSMVILAGAMKIFATMSWEDIGKGIAAVAASLVAIGLAMQLMPVTLPITGAGLVLVGTGLVAISGAMKLFASMSLGAIAKGVGAMAISLVAIAVAMTAMPITLPVTAAGLILVGIALTAISGAIALLGHQSVGTLVKGIAALAIALGVLAVGVTSMTAALPGSVALLAVAGALAIFVPTLAVLGNMGWGVIAKGLAAIAASLVIFGTLGALAAAGLVAIGAALAVFGVGVIAVGTGVLILAKGIAILGSTGAKGLAIFMASLTGMVALLPNVIIQFLKGFVQIGEGLIALGPKLVQALVAVIDILLQAIIREAPRFEQAFTALVLSLTNVITKNTGPIIKAGVLMITKLLTGIANSIGKVTTTVALIVTRFLSALASHAGQLINAGADLIVKVLNGLASNVGRVVAAAVNLVAKFINAIANQAGKLITAGANLIIKILNGIANKLDDVITAGLNLVTALFKAVVKASLRLVNAGATAVINFIHGIANAIRARSKELGAAGGDLAAAIITGTIAGFAGFATTLASKLLGGVKDAVNTAKDWLRGNPINPNFTDPKNLLGGKAALSQLQVSLTEAQHQILRDARLQYPLTKAIDASFINDPVLVDNKEMQKAGAYLVNGFAKGIAGSQDEINTAMKTLKDHLQSVTKSLADELKTDQKLIPKNLALIKKHQEQVKKWEKADNAEGSKTDHSKKIAKANADIADLKRLNKQLPTMIKETKHARNVIIDQATHSLNNEITQGKNDLIVLSKTLDVVKSKLKDAQQVLKDAKQTRDDYITSTTDAFSTLPTIRTDEDHPYALGNYITDLKATTIATQAYAKTLMALRALHLDDATYKKLVDDGIVDKDFADQLLAGGQAAIDTINSFDTALGVAAHGIGDTAAHDLYDTGVNLAEAIVKGLKDKKTEIEDIMNDIAKAMVRTMKKALKIQSPSKVFAQLGRYSAEGMAVGLRNSTSVITDATTGIGDDALSALRKSMLRVSDAVSNEIDMNPTITPVLDLSQIRTDAKKIGDVIPITAAASYGNAASISAAQADTTTSSDSTDSATGGVTLMFEQNNTSPVALSETEIYRKTNNQLSQAKKALGLA